MPDVVDVDAEPEQEIQILRVHRPGRKPSEAIDVDTASVHDSELQLRQFLHRAQKAKAQETQGQRAPQGPVAGPSNHNIIPRRSTHKTAQSSKPPVRMNQSVGQTQHADSPLREPHPQIIELSDGDNDSQPPPAKKVRKRFTPSSDDEYDTVHAGFDIKNDSIWTPLPERSTSSDDITSMLENTSISTPNPSVVKPLGGPIDYPVSLDIPGSWIWTQERLGFPRPKARNLTRDLHYDMLKQISSFRHVASSSINKIAQNGPLIAACSCTVDGFADFEDDSPSAPSPYNKPGSLFSIHGNDVNIIEGHSANIPRSVRVRYLEEGQGPDEFRDEELFETKYYTVNDVQFVPHWPAKLVSSGDDCHVCLWEYNNFDEDGIRMPPTLLKKVKYKHVPIDLKYRPGVSDESPLAVTCKDGKIYIYSQTRDIMNERSYTLTVAPPNREQAVGAMQWGVESTSDLLFASSEPLQEADHTGYHQAFDVTTRRVSFELDAGDAGDAMALHPLGDQLALLTTGEAANTLQLYDVRRRIGACTGTEQLVSFNGPGEVTTAQYSPDGIYLALARSDNSAHVYDSRMLSRGVVHYFNHPRSLHKNEGSGEYGVVEAQWVETRDRRRLGLVTGGSDGCIRLWDVRKASDDPLNGTVLAETDFNIGYFSLGDPAKQEKPLVVGDCGGGVYVYDRVPYDTGI